LLARLFKPRGQGPFPAIVELHGGAWCMGDRLNDATINEQLARSLSGLGGLGGLGGLCGLGSG
jgi:hypothetical protein